MLTAALAVSPGDRTAVQAQAVMLPVSSASTLTDLRVDGDVARLVFDTPEGPRVLRFEGSRILSDAKASSDPAPATTSPWTLSAETPATLSWTVDGVAVGTEVAGLEPLRGEAVGRAVLGAFEDAVVVGTWSLSSVHLVGIRSAGARPWRWRTAWLPAGPPLDVPVPAGRDRAGLAEPWLTTDVSLPPLPAMDAIAVGGPWLYVLGRLGTPEGPQWSLLVAAWVPKSLR